MEVKNLTFLKSSILLFSAMALFSCKKEDATEPKSNLNAMQLNDYVAKLPSVQQRTPFAERLAGQNVGRNVSLLDDAVFTANSSRYYEQAKEYENQLLFTENDEVFYPGALLKSKTVVDGSYSAIFAPRKPYTISTSLTGDKTSITVENASLSAARNAISELLNKNFNAPPANITYNSYEVHDEQHLKLALGASYTGAINSVKGNVNFKYETEKTRYIVKIEQVFYTIDVDAPQKPSDFFKEDFDFQKELGSEKPIYISSIKYGRVLLLGIESSLTKTEVEAKINASFLSGKISAEAETAFNDLKKSSTITGRVLGGNAKLAGKSIGDFNAIRTFLEEGATFGKDNLGVPISYRLRELGTNNVFRTVIYSKYLKNDAGSVDNKKLDFEILIKDGNLSDLLGRNQRVLHYVVNRHKEKNISSSDKLKYNYYQIIQAIPSLEKGEKITIDAVIKKEHGAVEVTFELPPFEDLVRKAMHTPTNKNMYDLDEGKDKGLQLNDTSGTYYLTIGIKNQKVN